MKSFRTIAVAALCLVSAAQMDLVAQGTSKAKWLILEPITYAHGVNRVDFGGFGGLLLTRFAAAGKYRVLDRAQVKTALVQEGLGANVAVLPAGYSVTGEFVEARRLGATQRRGQHVYYEYVVTVNLRVNALNTQEAYIGKDVRVQAYGLTPKDLSRQIADAIVREVLFKDFPPRIVICDENEIVVNYGKQHLASGMAFDVCEQKKFTDPDTGVTRFRNRKVGQAIVERCDEDTSTIKMLSGTAKFGMVLRPADGGDLPSVADMKGTGVTIPGGAIPPPAPVAVSMPGAVAVSAGRYPCVVTFGMAAEFEARRFVPDRPSFIKAVGAVGNLLGAGTARGRTRAGVAGAMDLFSDDSRYEPFRVHIAQHEWTGIAERAFANSPRFEVHNGIPVHLALQNGVRYRAAGSFLGLRDDGASCTVKVNMVLTDLERNGAIVKAQDFTVTVPGAYDGQSTFMQAAALAVAQFSNTL